MVDREMAVEILERKTRKTSLTRVAEAVRMTKMARRRRTRLLAISPFPFDNVSNDPPVDR